MTTNNEKTTAAVTRVEVKEGEPSLHWAVQFDVNGNRIGEGCTLWDGVGESKLVLTKRHGNAIMRELVKRRLLDEDRATEMVKSIAQSGLNEAVYIQECRSCRGHGTVHIFHSDDTVDNVYISPSFWGDRDGMHFVLETAIRQGMRQPTDEELAEFDGACSSTCEAFGRTFGVELDEIVPVKPTRRMVD